MKQFSKGSLVTVVNDDDKRIPEYLKNGWMETELTKKSKTEADERVDQAIEQANESEGKSKGEKRSATDKKVNEAIKSTETAADEAEVIDDGLIKQPITQTDNDGGKENG